MAIISVEARLKKAKHHEIAVRYRNGKKAFSMATLRVAQFSRFLIDVYGGEQLPDDDAGRIDARYMLDHLAQISGNAHVRMQTWLAKWAPWMAQTEATTLIDRVIAKPLRYRADTFGRLINLKEVDRARLGITTIASVDMTKAEREAARKARMRQAKRKKRRKQGVKPRAEYEEQSISRSKPWEARGISRAQWYRNRKAKAPQP